MFFDYMNRSSAAQRQRSSSGSRSMHSGLVQRASSLIGRHVKVNRGGPDMVDGRLLAIPADYWVVGTNDGIVYVNAAHVKSITEISGSVGSRSASRNFITASSFNSLLSRLRHQFVQINQGGPEKIDGFLAEINNDSLLLVVNRELVRIPVFHIKTVSVSRQNKQQKNSGSSGGNRSGGRSGGQSGGRSGSRSGSSGHRSGGRG